MERYVLPRKNGQASRVLETVLEEERSLKAGSQKARTHKTALEVIA